MNLLFPRIPLWDPDRFLKIWLPFAGPFISRIGMVIWLDVVGFALLLILPNSGEFAGQTQNFLQEGTVDMWILLGITFLGTKFLHEMGHAFACRRFGGECHEVGIMFLVLMPCPYVDASTAWGFESKWKRILVGAGGMIAEIFIAALAGIVWVITLNNGGTINEVAYYTMLIAGISTILFNANPLLRYDGYYILSDYLEIPNLQQKSREYSLGLIKRHLFRVKSTTPLPATLKQRAWLAVYWSVAGIYRMFIGFAILLMVLYQLPQELAVVGYFLAAGAIATFFIVPAFKSFKYLATEPELHRKRTRAWGYTGGAIAGIVALLAVVPFPSAVRAEAVSEPSTRASAVAMTPGRVAAVLVEDGQVVTKGTPLLRLENLDLETEVRVAELELQATQQQLNASRSQSPDLVPMAQRRVDQARERLNAATRQADELVVVSPAAGVVIAPRIAEREGMYVNRGDAIAQVVDASQLELFVVIDQTAFERIYQQKDQAVPQVRFAGKVNEVVEGDGFILDQKMMPAGTQDIRSAALTYAGGGTLTPDSQDPTKTATSQFEMRMTVPNSDEDGGLRFVPGQKAFVRIKLADEPIAKQAWRGLLQMVQSQTTARSVG